MREHLEKKLAEASRALREEIVSSLPSKSALFHVGLAQISHTVPLIILAAERAKDDDERDFWHRCLAQEAGHAELATYDVLLHCARHGIAFPDPGWHAPRPLLDLLEVLRRDSDALLAWKCMLEYDTAHLTDEEREAFRATLPNLARVHLAADGEHLREALARAARMDEAAFARHVAELSRLRSLAIAESGKVLLAAA